MNKLEIFAENHLALTKASLWSYLTLCIIIAIGSVGFGILMIEEMIFVCTGHNTLLQNVGLDMTGESKYCSNTEKHNYLTNSILEIVASFGFAYMMLGGYYFSKRWLNKHPNDENAQRSRS